MPYAGRAGGGGGSVIKNIQEVVISLTSGQTSATATISSVDTASSYLEHNGSDLAIPPSVDETSTRFVFTNATTITLIRGSSGIAAVEAKCTIIEYQPGVVSSIQRGVITSTTGSDTDTISSVDTAKSFVSNLGVSTTNNSTTVQETRAKLDLTNATTVTSARDGTATTVTVGYEVVEFV